MPCRGFGAGVTLGVPGSVGGNGARGGSSAFALSCELKCALVAVAAVCRCVGWRGRQSEGRPVCVTSFGCVLEKE